jgi:hypothetical protein
MARSTTRLIFAGPWMVFPEAVCQTSIPSVILECDIPARVPEWLTRDITGVGTDIVVECTFFVEWVFCTRLDRWHELESPELQPRP